MRDVGALWEQAACDHLTGAGLELITRNYQCRYGEIDLVMRDTGASNETCTVFVEVRYRRSAVRGGGLASVGAAKRTRLLRAASAFLQTRPELAAQPCRFDVVACSGTPRQAHFEWIRNAFDAC